MNSAFILKEQECITDKPYNIGHPAYLKVSGDNTQGQLSLLLGELKKGDSAPLHMHDMDEVFYILDGKFLFQLGNERITATIGDTVFITRNLPHTYLTKSSKGKVLFMFTPTKFTERLFEKLSLSTTLPTSQELEEMKSVFGLKIVGPPITE